MTWRWIWWLRFDRAKSARVGPRRWRQDGWRCITSPLCSFAVLECRYSSMPVRDYMESTSSSKCGFCHFCSAILPWMPRLLRHPYNFKKSFKCGPLFVRSACLHYYMIRKCQGGDNWSCSRRSSYVSILLSLGTVTIKRLFHGASEVTPLSTWSFVHIAVKSLRERNIWKGIY